MLWKQLNPRYRSLLSSGERGKAVVVAAKADRGGGSNVGPGIYGWKVTLRVKFADGTVQDFGRYIEASSTDVMAVAPGMLVPIRFDPKNRSRVEIDTNALRATRDSRRTERSAEVDAAVRQAEAQLEPIDGPGQNAAAKRGIAESPGRVETDEEMERRLGLGDSRELGGDQSLAEAEKEMERRLGLDDS